MANPYVLRDKQLDIVAGARSPVVIKELGLPKPPIRQLPLPTVLIPIVKKGT